MYYMHSNVVQRLPNVYIMTKEISLPEKRKLNCSDMTYFLDGPDTSGKLELGGCVHPLVVGNAELLKLRLFVLLLLVSPPSNFIIYKFKVGICIIMTATSFNWNKKPILYVSQFL